MEKRIGNKIRIFIVEDDPVQGQVMVDIITSFNENVKVNHFISGEDLYEFLKTYTKESKFHYLILDYYLQTEDNKEGANGSEVIKYLHENYSDIKIILFFGLR